MRFAAPARADIVELLTWSEARFGVVARNHYVELVEFATRQIADEPVGAGRHERADIDAGLWSFHLRSVVGRRVRTPRHILFYRFDESVLKVIRVLHESRDLNTELPVR